MTLLTRDIAALLAAALAKPACDTTRGALADAMQDADCWTREAILPWVLKWKDNDAPRLLYASWCEQHGEPQRGEFIKVQCELAAIDRLRVQRKRVKGGVEPRRTQLERRELVLLNQYGWHMWQGVCRDIIPKGEHIPSYIEFARGFIASVTCTAADWLKHADAIVAEQPIEKVRLTNLAGWECKSSCPISLPGGGYPDDRWPGIAFELPPVRITGTMGRVTIGGAPVSVGTWGADATS